MKPELLAPAGGQTAASVALSAGADAVYLGLPRFSARQSAENFNDEALLRTLRDAHLLGAKVYVALNTLVKEEELDAFFEAALAAWNSGCDAILIQDLFLGRELKRRYPSMELHLSTQAGCCNVLGAKVAKDYGFSRVVLARETPIADMGAISKVIETEVFVQGALCSSFSGQCYFSSFVGGNSGNRGRCKQPCRKRYAIDRKGYEALSYALSPGDLSLGRRLGQLLDAGVTSFKIEGRMRRPEYVGAAVKYFRALLGGASADGEFEALRRAYARGNYTEGLGFGQKKDFLTRNVQGHIGQSIGTVTLRRGRPVCLTDYAAEDGDGLKILRGGKEVGGALFGEKTEGGYVLRAGKRLCEGDDVRLTTCMKTNREALVPVRTRSLDISLRFLAGQVPEARAEGLVFSGDVPLERARSAALTEAELTACFQKTDLPVSVRVTADMDGVFLVKSALNAFRRAFYDALTEHLLPKREPLKEVKGDVPALVPQGARLRAVISDEAEACDLLIYKPHDFGRLVRPAGKCVYLYLPAFLPASDEAAIAPHLSDFDGIFCEGYYGMALAEKYGLPLFAGEGFHITNRYGAAGVRAAAAHFTLSKEISAREQRELLSDGAFVTYGGLKLMDLCYCPFEQTCAACDRRRLYRLTDEDGRSFPLVRTRYAQAPCRFEVYNCALLEDAGLPASVLCDDTLHAAPPMGKTRGHAERSML